VWRGKRGRRAGAKDGPVRAAASRGEGGTGDGIGGGRREGVRADARTQETDSREVEKSTTNFLSPLYSF
jgi:hypothetical protein